MNNVVANIALVLLFILIGGFFAAAEIALVSLRESQIGKLGEQGRRGARVARLANDPNRFLSAVQIGVTVATMLSAAFGADTLAGELVPVLADWGVPGGLAPPVALVLVTLAISYVSLVLGELAPKRLALQRAEGLSLLVAPTLDRLAALSRPIIWLLSKSTDLVVRLLGGNPETDREAMSTEELRDIVAGHQELPQDERQLIVEVFAAGKRQLREVMRPRTEVEFMAADTTLAEAAVLAATMPHSRFPVYRDSYDDVLGFVHVRDLLDPVLTGRTEPISELVTIRPVKMVPATKRVLPTLSEMRDEGHHLAIVVDEYGGTAGIVTLEDLVEELIGDIRDEYDVEDDQAVRLPAGEIEMDGLANLDDVEDETGIRLPRGPYETLGGFMMAALGRVPQHGDEVDFLGFQFAVTEMDARRVARVRILRRPLIGPEPPPGDPSEPGESLTPEKNPAEPVESPGGTEK
ncbi:hemolysin family protein [Spongiactinospora sp. TRM90649]|uniref:hemolysin family protein n=1 Tax=Spongiactinospora sp. TRM90649 TaxID=3031114 RepID=UPI0023F9F549|nr:hemolysin family protein [Spongiactinospora sp. TRM90649]MDF5751315.1 hemolysin family protein [Spongiactinospora sp. TRM90649]